MHLYGLIGQSLSHSFSGDYFKEKFRKLSLKNHEYRLFELNSINELTYLIQKKPDLKGFNVTIPFKQSIIPFLSTNSECVKNTGAVNTVKIFRNKTGYTLYGDNTDYHGFIQSLKGSLPLKHSAALILGTGGAAKTVSYVLRELGMKTTLVSRQVRDHANLSYQNLNRDVFETHTFIVNATPVGMFPLIENCPEIPYDCIDNRHLVYDLVYNPAETLFLYKSRLRGASVMNGLEMLYAQAEKSWQIWAQDEL